MKIKQLGGVKFAAILSSGLIAAAGIAGAQTTAYYTNPGSGANGGAAGIGDLDSIGFDSWQYTPHNGGVSDTGINQTNPYQSTLTRERQINFAAAGLPATSTVDGGALESVTLFLYVTGLNPDGTPLGFTVWNGLNGTGTSSRTLNMTGGSIENTFYSLVVTADEFLGGFSITSDGLPQGTGISLQFASEENADPLRHPGLLASYGAPPIPEPSAALLGAVGALALIRRRRA